jgi:hypothetical protein
MTPLSCCDCSDGKVVGEECVFDCEEFDVFWLTIMAPERMHVKVAASLTLSDAFDDMMFVKKERTQIQDERTQIYNQYATI